MTKILNQTNHIWPIITNANNPTNQSECGENHSTGAKGGKTCICMVPSAGKRVAGAKRMESQVMIGWKHSLFIFIFLFVRAHQLLSSVDSQTKTAPHFLSYYLTCYSSCFSNSKISLLFSKHLHNSIRLAIVTLTLISLLVLTILYLNSLAI